MTRGSKRLLFAAALLAACRAAGAGVDEPGAPPTRVPGAERIVAIGDLHGDLGAARRALRLGGLIDDRNRWIGGATVLVQTGDVLDRGPDERAILELLEALAQQAPQAGGAVVALNGNHEIVNVNGSVKYAGDVECAAFADHAPGGRDEPRCSGRLAALRAGGPWAKRLARRNVVAVVGDTVFLHGGLRKKHVEYGLERLNREIRAWMRGEGTLPEFVLDKKKSPVWIRDYSEAPKADDCEAARKALNAVPAARMVVGHTVQRDGISPACGGLVWRIDTGMSRAMGGRVEALELRGGEARVLREPAPEAAIPAMAPPPPPPPPPAPPGN